MSKHMMQVIEPLIPISIGVFVLIAPPEFWREYKKIKHDSKKVKSMKIKNIAFGVIMIIFGILWLLIEIF